MENVNLLLSEKDIESLKEKGRLVKGGSLKEDRPAKIKIWYIT